MLPSVSKLFSAFLVSVEQMLLHSLGRVENLLAYRASHSSALVMHPVDMLVQMSPGAKTLVTMVTLEVFLLGPHFFTLVHPFHMQLQRGIRIDMFATQVAPVGQDIELFPQMLHEQAHVLEGFATVATFQLGKLVVWLRFVDMLVHFGFVLEQDVVHGAGNDPVVDQDMRFHVFASLEFHGTMRAMDFARARAAFLHMRPVAGAATLELAALRARHQRIFGALSQPFGCVVVLQMRQQVAFRAPAVAAVRARERARVIVRLQMIA